MGPVRSDKPVRAVRPLIQFKHDLDQARCSNPACTHEHRDAGPVVLHARCHPSAGHEIEYSDGALTVRCNLCRRFISKIAVAEGPGPEAELLAWSGFIKILSGVYLVLRSYEFGNRSPDLAKQWADLVYEILKEPEEAFDETHG